MCGELPSVSSTEIRKARKQHTCCECGKTILIAEKYQHTKGCWSGEWADFKTCGPCADLRAELSGYDGVPPFGDLREWASEAGINL